MKRSGFYMHIEGFEGFDRNLDFDKAQIRRGMRRAGSVVTKEARRLVSRRRVSRPGEYPGKGTGRLARSIRARVSRSGFLVKIEPKTGGDVPASDPYFVYLHYGVRRGARRRKDHKAQPAGPWRIEPRENYPADALQNRAAEVRSILGAALAAGLRVR